MSPRWLSVIPVWVVAVLGAVLVGALAGDRYLDWLAVVLAGCTLLAFVIQLAVSQRIGLVTRLMASVAGALAVLVVATGVLFALHPAVPLIG